MAKIFVMPVICREDYDAFRRDVGSNLADTYDQWAKLFADEVADARRSGKTVIEVAINYSEFASYCHANGKKPDAQTLLNFAAHRPRGEA